MKVNLPTPGRNLTMSVTGLILMIVCICLGIYDLVCLVLGFDSTISQFVVATTHASPVLSFCCGCLVAHLFMNVYPEEKK